jgi:hypothetical protein
MEMMGFADSTYLTRWMVPSGGTALPHNSQPGRRSLAVAFLAQVPLSSLLYISPGTKSPGAAFWALGAGRLAGNIMLSRNYFVSQVTSLLKFAQETTDPKLAAVLIEKAADLKSQVDESSMTPAATARAPEVRPETSRVE